MKIMGLSGLNFPLNQSIEWIKYDQLTCCQPRVGGYVADAYLGRRCHGGCDGISGFKSCWNQQTLPRLAPSSLMCDQPGFVWSLFDPLLCLKTLSSHPNFLFLPFPPTNFMALQLDLVWGTARLRQEILHDSSFHPVLPHWGTLAMSVATPVALMFAAFICIDVKGLPLFWLILSARIDHFDHLTNLVVSGNHPKWC